MGALRASHHEIRACHVRVMSHISPCVPPPQDVCPLLTSLSPDRPQTLLEVVASAQAELQRCCTFKIASITLPWASTDFLTGISEFQGKVCVAARFVSHPDSAHFPKV